MTSPTIWVERADKGRRIGAVVLALFALSKAGLWFALGYPIALHIEFIAHVLPDWAWVAVWIFAGAICLAGTFSQRLFRWGTGLVGGLSFIWGVGYVTVGLVIPDAFGSAVCYLAMAGMAAMTTVFSSLLPSRMRGLYG
ncbi:hypothetical protein [Corynebacterium sp. TAE3-ERU16]|uniref:hypothetical protein n=1 Tax=Corynebacterium sp. TAE3-ERU16 TaxID=2849493 RepID=UPI001C474778|nr:hypothetical protein [Corynebacterium sp. TAE3-ERU16]MBV7292386.1 hypothetical protein [Corynebacterium sp. TAE3-ERU16]